jgi:hypothetical protein
MRVYSTFKTGPTGCSTLCFSTCMSREEQARQREAADLQMKVGPRVDLVNRIIQCKAEVFVCHGTVHYVCSMVCSPHYLRWQLISPPLVVMLNNSVLHATQKKLLL